MVNFHNVIARPSLKEDTLYSYDIAKDLAEEIYTKTILTEDYDLSLKLFNNDGDIDLTREETDIIYKYIKDFPVWMQSAIVSMCETSLNPPTPPAIPGEPSPDGGVYAGDNGVEPIVETTDDTWGSFNNLDEKSETDTAADTIKSKKKTSKKK